MPPIAEVLGQEPPAQKFDHGDEDGGVLDEVSRVFRLLTGPSTTDLQHRAALRARFQTGELREALTGAKFPPLDRMSRLTLFAALMGQDPRAGDLDLAELVTRNLRTREPGLSRSERLRRGREFAEEFGPSAQFLPEGEIDTRAVAEAGIERAGAQGQELMALEARLRRGSPRAPIEPPGSGRALRTILRHNARARGEPLTGAEERRIAAEIGPSSQILDLMEFLR